jgi:hypothetical protein
MRIYSLIRIFFKYERKGLFAQTWTIGIMKVLKNREIVQSELFQWNKMPKTKEIIGYQRLFTNWRIQIKTIQQKIG